LPPVRAEAGRGFFDFYIEIFENRLEGADDERQPDESECNEYAERSKRNFKWSEQAADPAIGRIDRGQRDSCHRCRKRKRQVDKRVDEPLSRERVADERPREYEPEHGIDRGCEERRAEAQAIRRDDSRRRDRIPELIPAQRSGLEKYGGERNQHDERKVDDSDAERQSESRNWRSNLSWSQLRQDPRHES
jgi:hypothetical protein